ncbi:hypothetical protein N3K66_005164 [Trichothecium roseum]|uniref:Uncharacterized protein n=1 Tax=Trichothecium roseum TaxID=47278 RepID=A0ACC0V3M6_9HYPO|nr:hypothetical protein N3K66_005164 [Trichothecium roseum]
MDETGSLLVNMEDDIARLVAKTWARYQVLPADKRLLIGIAGIPGSGKTTLASAVTARLQALHNNNTITSSSPPPTSETPKVIAQCLSMDGFHLPRAALSAMPDPARAHARRGAAFTFDAPAFLDLVTSLRRPLPPPSPPSSSSSHSSSSPPIMAPSFDHAVKDPVQNDVSVHRDARIVLVEGNYVALDEPVWRDARALFDEVWFVEVDLGVARARLAARHVRAGIAADLEAGDRRAIENDIPNGREIIGKLLPVDEVIRSR